MSESGRQVGCGMLISTSFPFTLGSQRTNPALSADSDARGMMATSAVMPRGGVGALQACIVASSWRARGETSISPLGPRVQSRQVPYGSFFAGNTHDAQART